VELERPGCVLAGAVRTTVPRLVGERFLSGVRVANGDNWFAAQRQAHVQSEPGPEQSVIRRPPTQTAEDCDQYHGQWIERHVMRSNAISVSLYIDHFYNTYTQYCIIGRREVKVSFAQDRKLFKENKNKIL